MGTSKKKAARNIHAEGSYFEGGVHVQNGDLVGRDKIINHIYYYYKHPSEWPSRFWGAITRNWLAIFTIILAEIALLAVFLRFRNLYLIPEWMYLVAALALATTTCGWYFWIRYGRNRANFIFSFAAGIPFLLLVGWQAFSIALPYTLDEQSVGIAVAELGEGPDFKRTKVTREISDHIYQSICAGVIGGEIEFGERSCRSTSIQPGRRNIEILRVGVIPDSITTREYGKKINADVVIWGQVLTSQEGRVTIRYQLLEVPDRSANPNFPVVLPVTVNTSEITSGEMDVSSDVTVLKRVATQQSKFLSSFILGMVAYMNREHVDAIQQFEAAAEAIAEGEDLSVNPAGEVLVYYYLGRASQALGRMEEGQVWLEKALKIQPTEPATYLALALGYRSKGEMDAGESNLQDAMVLLNRWIQQHPDDKNALYDRAIIHQVRKMPRNAIFDYQKVLDLDSEFYIAYISLGQVYDQALQSEDAVNAVRKAISLAEQAGTNPSWAHLNLAVIYENASRMEEAREQYKLAIEHDEEVDWMYFFYARFLEKQQEIDAAWENYQKLIRYTKDKGWGYNLFAEFLARFDLHQEAVEYYLLALHEEEENALIHTNLADSYMETGEYEKARSAYEKAIALNDQISYIFAKYAQFLNHIQAYDQAANMFERALVLQPGDYAILLNLALVYEQRQMFDEALEIYQGIIQAADDHPEFAVQIAAERLALLDKQ